MAKGCAQHFSGQWQASISPVNPYTHTPAAVAPADRGGRSTNGALLMQAAQYLGL